MVTSNIYTDSVTKIGRLVNAKKIVGLKEIGALYAYYILSVQDPCGGLNKYLYYPDDNILTYCDKDIVFDCAESVVGKLILHIY